MDERTDVLVLGIGNLLWADEGFGVRAVEALHAAFWTYSQSLGLIVDEFHPAAQEDFRKRYRAGEQSLSRADHWDAVGAYEELPPDHPLA